MAARTKERTEKAYVLTKKDAWMLLAATSDYLHTPDRTIDGKDRADILAEAALAQGYSHLSQTISAIHSSVIGFHKGHYKEMQYLLEGPAIREYVRDEAKGTPFETAVGSLFSALGYIADLDDKVRGRSIDWETSSKVLLAVKRDKFAEDMTMVEKLAVGKSAPTKRAK
jgi:hypothetical protein